ncbi:N-acetylmuramoyl-L-alanine amidase [Candidatus Palauibacter soopunensis]|uniref:N-acetylmuramoyl-L-alanine amidase family protein n=1 Tax=Candidatus Palauibacter soopunensis TaxID=3056739 RepID=UPI0023A764B8|nr:N-acetylmuramoyl-L-alanine amidase [Candidatus Palauibacter soopunensis]MDE2878059.1 N-acetylmuramoyl-L-alanine amidase [Candidatus Palauibacter soopunensis]
MAGDRGAGGERGRVGAGGRIVAAAVVVAQAMLSGTLTGIDAQAPPETVQAEVSGRTVSLAVARHRAYPAVDVTDLALALEGVLEDVTRNGVFLRARLHGDEVAFEAESPFFRRGGRAVQLANPPYEEGGAFWLPAEFLTRWVSEGPPPVAAVSEGSQAPDSSPASPSSPPATDPLPARVDPAAPWRVIIDPGHGGRDPGTLGSASYEKDIVLAIARRLYEELEGREMVEPHMTRDADVYVDLDERSQFAVDRAGDLFVSIHANAAGDERARGFETIFLGQARSEEAREVALRENRGPEVDDAAGSPSDVQFILAGLDRTENLAESRLFAGFVQNSIRTVRRGGSPDRGVIQGPWWVLLGALVRMPSVIVEVGFLSNDEEERYLNGEEGQRAIARAIADAIIAYREDVLRRYAPPPESGC